MAEMLKTGAEFLRDNRKEQNARDVIYKRGVYSVLVKATLGRKLLKLGDEFGGVRMEWTARDYLIAGADLPVAGITLPPLKGDLIEDSTDGKTYKVLAPEGEPVWQPHDHFGITLRIHTKLV